MCRYQLGYYACDCYGIFAAVRCVRGAKSVKDGCCCVMRNVGYIFMMIAKLLPHLLVFALLWLIRPKIFFAFLS